MKHVVFLGDGMADDARDELDGRTLIEAADTPNMDRIAREGVCGLLDTVPEGLPPDSTVAFPPLDRDKEIVVRSADVRTDVADQDLAITSARWQITSFRTGEFAVCTNAIVIRAANGDVTEASFPFLGFSVLTTLTNDLRALTPDKGLAAWPASLGPGFLEAVNCSVPALK